MVFAAPSSPAAAFYLYQFFATSLWWLFLLRVKGRHLYDLPSARGSVLTRPRWLPAGVLRRLHKDRRAIFTLLPLALLIAAWASDSFAARLLAALAVSAYHLLETASTQRHGEFPVLYNSWAMLWPDPAVQAGLSLGIAVHFVLSSGMAKVFVGGGSAWLAPSTMTTYLAVYGDSKSAGPISKTLNRVGRDYPLAATLISAGTLLVECVLAPACILLLGPEQRWLLCALMLLMHVGIALVMSVPVALAFFTVVPAYLVGFSSTGGAALSITFGTPQWIIALVVGLGPTALCLLGLGGGGPRGRLLVENWPVSAISLFMFSGGQALTLAAALMTGDTRVVMATEEAVRGADKAGQQNEETEGGASGGGALVGSLVAHHGAVMPAFADGTDGGGAATVVHDAVLRVIAFTLVQGDLIDALPPAAETGRSLAVVTSSKEAEAKVEAEADDKGQEARCWNVRPFLQRLEGFLQREQRLIERHSGRPLTRAFFVKIDLETGKVVSVLGSGGREAAAPVVKKRQ